MLQAFFRYLGYGLCHQLPSRSLFAGGLQLPVCARDTGIYAGFALSLAAVALLERGRKPTELPSVPVVVAGILGVMAMLFDGVSSYGGFRETTNAMRLATGLAAGYALPLVVVPMLNGQMWRSSVREPLLSGWRAWAWVAGGPVAFAALRWVMPQLGVLYPAAVSAAIVVTLVAVNMVFVTLLPVFERAADRLRDAAPQVAAAFGLAVVEIAGAGLLRVLLERAWSS